jgi:hypothetical protein
MFSAVGASSYRKESSSTRGLFELLSETARRVLCSICDVLSPAQVMVVFEDGELFTRYDSLRELSSGPLARANLRCLDGVRSGQTNYVVI